MARTCGIIKATIYRYRGSKDEVLHDILDVYLAGLRDRICGLDLAGIDPKAALRRTVSEILLAYPGAEGEHRLQASGLKHLSPQVQAILHGYRRELAGHVAGSVGAVAVEVFAKDAEKLRAATMSVLGMPNGVCMWNRNATEADRRAHARSVCNLCLRRLSGL